MNKKGIGIMGIISQNGIRKSSQLKQKNVAKQKQ